MRTWIILILLLIGGTERSLISELKPFIASIPGSIMFRRIKKVYKGLSGFQKYYIETNKKETVLLQIGDATDYSYLVSKEKTLRMMWTNGIPCQRPISSNYCKGNKSFLLTSWIPGEDLEEILPTISSEAQYDLGKNAATLLRRIHDIDISEKNSINSFKKMLFDNDLNKYKYYRECGNLTSNEEIFYSFILSNIQLLKYENVSVLHGDYNVGNLILNEKGLHVIDFVPDKYGNPVEDFIRNLVNAETSCHFAKGLVDGYFDSKVLNEVWPLLAVYTAIHQLEIIDWQTRYKCFHSNFIKKQHDLVLKNYDYMNSIIPMYYLEEE